MTDQLCYISEPKLIFNRQQLQGGVMPSSVRFEHNGWACGDWWYDYDAVSNEKLNFLTNSLSTGDPDLQAPVGPDLQVLKRHTYVSPIYNIENDDVQSKDKVKFDIYPFNSILKYDQKPFEAELIAKGLRPLQLFTPGREDPFTRFPVTSTVTKDIIHVMGYMHNSGYPYEFYMDITNPDSPSVYNIGEYVWHIADPVIYNSEQNDTAETGSFVFNKTRYTFTFKVLDKDVAFNDTITFYTAPALNIGEDSYNLEMSLDSDGKPEWSFGEFIKAKYDKLTSKWVYTSEDNLTDITFEERGTKNELNLFRAVLPISFTDTLSFSNEFYGFDATFQSISGTKYLGNTGSTTVLENYENKTEIISANTVFYRIDKEVKYEGRLDEPLRGTHTDELYVLTNLPIPVTTILDTDFSNCWFQAEPVYDSSKKLSTINISLRNIYMTAPYWLCGDFKSPKQNINSTLQLGQALKADSGQDFSLSFSLGQIISFDMWLPFEIDCWQLIGEREIQIQGQFNFTIDMAQSLPSSDYLAKTSITAYTEPTTFKSPLNQNSQVIGSFINSSDEVCIVFLTKDAVYYFNTSSNITITIAENLDIDETGFMINNNNNDKLYIILSKVHYGAARIDIDIYTYISEDFGAHWTLNDVDSAISIGNDPDDDDDYDYFITSAVMKDDTIYICFRGQDYDYLYNRYNLDYVPLLKTNSDGKSWTSINPVVQSDPSLQKPSIEHPSGLFCFDNEIYIVGPHYRDYDDYDIINEFIFRLIDDDTVERIASLPDITISYLETSSYSNCFNGITIADNKIYILLKRKKSVALYYSTDCSNWQKCIIDDNYVNSIGTPIYSSVDGLYRLPLKAGGGFLLSNNGISWNKASIPNSLGLIGIVDVNKNIYFITDSYSYYKLSISFMAGLKLGDTQGIQAKLNKKDSLEETDTIKLDPANELRLFARTNYAHLYVVAQSTIQGEFAAVIKTNPDALRTPNLESFTILSLNRQASSDKINLSTVNTFWKKPLDAEIIAVSPVSGGDYSLTKITFAVKSNNKAFYSFSDITGVAPFGLEWLKDTIFRGEVSVANITDSWQYLSNGIVTASDLGDEFDCNIDLIYKIDAAYPLSVVQASSSSNSIYHNLECFKGHEAIGSVWTWSSNAAIFYEDDFDFQHEDNDGNDIFKLLSPFEESFVEGSLYQMYIKDPYSEDNSLRTLKGSVSKADEASYNYKVVVTTDNPNLLSILVPDQYNLVELRIGPKIYTSVSSSWTPQNGIIDGQISKQKVTIKHTEEALDYSFDYNPAVNSFTNLGQFYDFKGLVSNGADYGESTGLSSIPYVLGEPVVLTDSSAAIELTAEYIASTELCLPWQAVTAINSISINKISNGVYIFDYNDIKDELTYISSDNIANSKTYSVTDTTKEANSYLINSDKVTISLKGYDFDRGSFTVANVYNVEKSSGYKDVKFEGLVETEEGLKAYLKYANTQVTLTGFDKIKTAITIRAGRSDLSKADETADIISQIITDSEYQLIKQDWQPDVKVENIWWLTQSQKVVLDRNYFRVYEKNDTDGGDLDDWAGDRWHEVISYRKDRSQLIPSTVKQYGVSSVYGEYANANKGAFWWSFETFGSDKFKINFAYLNVSDATAVSKTRIIDIKHKDFGIKLSETSLYAINTYSNITSEELCSEASITATHVGSWCLLGIHLDNNLRQWTLVFNASDFSFIRCITGYGYVGPSGSLTGGEFPTNYVTVNEGFVGTVKPLTDLSSDKFKTESIEGSWTPGIYGTEVQQWYVSPSISGVCSHIEFNMQNETNQNVNSVPFILRELPIENNYSAKYESPSIFLNTIKGFYPQALTLNNLLPFSNFKGLLKTVMKIFTPQIWVLAPVWTRFGFLQQSIGQYAYVYDGVSQDTVVNKSLENEDSSSTKDTNNKLLSAFSNADKVLTKDSFTFDKQSKSQTIGKNNASASKLTLFWLNLFASASTIMSQTPVKVNETQNQTTASNIAKQMGQYAIDAAFAAATTDIGIKTNTALTMASEVVATKSLDMFYSTSSLADMYAGPGYTCLSYIAKCVAQSMSNRFIQGNQTSMFSVLWPLTQIELSLRNIILSTTADLALEAARVWNGGVFGLGTGTSLIGSITGSALIAVQYALKLLVKKNDWFIEWLPKLLKTITPSENTTLTPAGALSSHTIDIEAKHNYGSKHCTFMWPCFGCQSTKMTIEGVQAVVKTTQVDTDFSPSTLSEAVKLNGDINLATGQLDNITSFDNNSFKENLTGKLISNYIYCKGTAYKGYIPADMAVIEGCDRFLPETPFKNENINVETVASPLPTQDYMLSDTWQLSATANQGGILWLSIKDTKIIDGSFSNIVMSDSFLGVASPYTAVEVHKQIEPRYIRPIAASSVALGWNFTGLNASYEGKMYHAFDGVGQRITQWQGTSGMNIEHLTYHYCFQKNDRFKRSNILTPNIFFGAFNSAPIVAIDSRDTIYNDWESDELNKTGYISYSDNKNTPRYAVPVFTEQLSTMPSVLRTLSSYKLSVVDGVTGLVTDLRTTQNVYKAPPSVDFNINKQVFRATDEYVCLVNDTGLSVNELVAKLGMTFIGSTPTQAFFYSAATRAYYSFTGSSTITKQDIWSRFYNVKDGRWDFVNQQVVFQCLAENERIFDGVSDSDRDEWDNLMIMNMNNDGIIGDITIPNKTIFDQDSWFKTYSFSQGLCFQGPNRFIINRSICLDYMVEDIINNRGKWKKVSKDEFYPFRKYEDEFESVDKTITSPDAVTGWTHNPYLLATAPLGINVETDCLFEWQIVFTWTDIMEKIYGDKNYMCINIMAQTMCPGGKKRSDVTHLYLTKEQFTRAENTGYYSFTFTSRNGAGNREQLFLWSDSYIAVTGLQLEVKPVTEKRQTPLRTSQVDIKQMEEF